MYPISNIDCYQLRQYLQHIEAGSTTVHFPILGDQDMRLVITPTPMEDSCGPTDFNHPNTSNGVLTITQKFANLISVSALAQ
jgi:hypothetical protein